MGRRIRIIMIGAGLSGIGAVKLFKDTFPDRDVDFVIYEKNSDVTGTWLENRYPGCACDVPAHAYTYSWEGNPHWSRPYVGAVELYNYFKGRATAYGIAEFLHLENKVTGASWDDQRGKWIVQVKDLRTGSTFADEGEILINASGFLNSWNWPEIPGLKKFEGKLLHSADWDHNYDFHNKTVVLIGSGSSAVQIVPQLQPIVKHMYSINRSKGWISPHFASQFAPEGPNTIFTKEQQLRWEKDKDGFLAYRREIEAYLNGSFELYHKNSDLQKWASENYRETMCERLGYNEELIKKLVPDEQVGCRRLTPGYGYLEALASNNVAVKTDAIKEITSSGLRMGDGSFLKVDAIICATGFDTSYRPAFPVVAFGRDLRDAWKDEPRSYLSIAAAGIPNYFIMSGPNFSVSNGGLIPCLEANVRYAFAVAKKIQREGIKSLAPKQEAVDDFQQYKDAIMENLVWSGNCVSWYKRNGKVWGPWPGSSLHYLETLSTPRWEDYEISYQRRNRFTYLGNGRTTREKIGKDLAYYVQEPGSKL
ncbi:FAD/NAD(P)-binding domain-containing protein [Plenodomus tracheiphilus IPT5]|uniref:FAD/NAD(P)-binding domain-containing protein n=1 Tax=Plenodomus tracheiphilus IPT5 TaxID=1408161 RepID=A0A6A7AXG3_9PLEO|nr:FAD/NAD(P)-binding domain-containing protein [Plenodomus tracheiphilus IPT5]